MKHIIPTVAVTLVLALLAGCVPFQGQSYLEERKYDEGVRAARATLSQEPDNYRAHYYMGRYYLALGRYDEALASFRKAADLFPYDADYQFWQGIAHWGLEQPEQEREAYLRAVELNARHVSALVYLGHNLFDQGEYRQALEQYDQALRWDRYEPGALFNRAVALRELNRRDEYIEAMETYLDYYPDGAQSRKGVEMLNADGVFSYRLHTIGRRTVTLHAIDFEPGTTTLSREARPSLDFVAAILEENPDLGLHVVAYVDGDKQLARERARRIRTYMTRKNPDIADHRLPLSWFGQPETVATGSGEQRVAHSVEFITRVE